MRSRQDIEADIKKANQVGNPWNQSAMRIESELLLDIRELLLPVEEVKVQEFEGTGIENLRETMWANKVRGNLLRAGCEDPETCAGECLARKHITTDLLEQMPQLIWGNRRYIENGRETHQGYVWRYELPEEVAERLGWLNNEAAQEDRWVKP